MTPRTLPLLAASTLIIAACATPQENPNYEISTKYKASNPYKVADAIPNNVQYANVVPVRYNGSVPAQYSNTVQESYTQLDQNCLNKERNRQLIGGGVGGAVGAIAGKKLIGGTVGTLAGAAVGGTAGYGLGGSTVDCESLVIPANQSSYNANGYSQSRYVPAQGSAYQGQAYSAPQTYSASQTYPASQAADQHIASEANQAPTDTEYGETYGTPGYHAIQSTDGTPYPPQPTPNPAKQADTTAQYVPPTGSPIVEPQQYSAPPTPNPVRPQPQRPVQQAPVQQPPIQQPLTQVAPQAVAPSAASPIYGSSFEYVVQQGDTAYSIARSVCSDVETLRRMNDLGSDFTVKIGFTLTLPASRC